MKMTRRVMMLGLAAVALVLVGGGASAQGELTVRLDPSGMVQVSRGAVEIAMIELNAHGPGWQHAPQASATAQASAVPQGRQFTGTLPIPNTDGGAIEYTQTVTALPRGVRIRYDLAMTREMRLHGLQASILLPVAAHAGSEVLISQPHGDPEIAGLPQDQPEQGRAQLWSGSGSKVEVGQGTDNAVIMELRASTDVIVQDLREWEHEIFEVRFPAIMEGDGRRVSAEDRFHLDLIVTFASPVTHEAQ